MAFTILGETDHESQYISAEGIADNDSLLKEMEEWADDENGKG